MKTDKDIYVLKEKLKDFVVQNTKLIAEIPSTKAILCQHDNVAKDSELMDFYHHNKPHIINTTTILELSNTLHQVSDGVKTAHETPKNMCTELLVWVVSDVYRRYQSKQVHALPIAYALKGYSLTVPIFRKMHLDMILRLYQQ